jgi:hypothetical protein
MLFWKPDVGRDDAAISLAVRQADQVGQWTAGLASPPPAACDNSRQTDINIPIISSGNEPSLIGEPTERLFVAHIPSLTIFLVISSDRGSISFFLVSAFDAFQHALEAMMRRS